MIHPRRDGPRERLNRLGGSIIAALCACVMAGCSAIVQGQVAYTLNDPNRAGGLPVTNGPSGVRDHAPAPHGEVLNTDGGPQDKLGLLAVNDVEEYWRQYYNPKWKGGQFRSVAEVYSYDSHDPNSPEICGNATAGSPNAFFYRNDLEGCDLIAWDRGAFVPAGEEYFGDFSIAALIAHEYGHAVQFMAGLANSGDPVIVREQQADCFAGVYTRWVAEGNSKRFQVSTGDGLNLVLAGVLTIADDVLTERTRQGIVTGHGTALDRISAFQMGFVNGSDACAAIDENEIDKRRDGLPLVLEDDSDGGNITVDEATLQSLMTVMGQVFSPKDPPTLSFDSADCPDAQRTDPASYCPATNTISVDLPKLQAMSKPTGYAEKMLIAGDNTALALVMSRYTLAVQKEHGGVLDTPVAALRSACLTGVGQRGMAQPGGDLVLTAGDLDEAVAGLLTNGLVASDVNGVTVPAGFTRIAAFRAGVQTDMADCFARFK